MYRRKRSVLNDQYFQRIGKEVRCGVSIVLVQVKLPSLPVKAQVLQTVLILQ